MSLRAGAIIIAIMTSGCCDGQMPIGGVDMCMVAIPDGTSTSDDSDGSTDGSSGVLMSSTSNGFSETSDSDPTTGSTGMGPAVGDCCEQYGSKYGGICTLSKPGQCIGCDWWPVLCMTHGCSEIGVQDCCLDDKGMTVPCMPG